MSLSLPTLSTFTFPVCLPIQKSIEASTTGQTSTLSHEELVTQLKQFYEQRQRQTQDQARPGQQAPSQPVTLPTSCLVTALQVREDKPQSLQVKTTRIKRSASTNLPIPLKPMREIKSRFPQEVDEKGVSSQAEDTVFEQDMGAPEKEESEHVDTSWALRESIFAKRVSYDRITQEVGKMLNHVQQIYEQKIVLTMEKTPSLNRLQVEQHLLETLKHSSGISLHLQVEDIDGTLNTYNEKHHVNPQGAKTLAGYYQDCTKKLSEFIINKIQVTDGEGRIDILRMDLKLEYPNLKEVEPISPSYIHAFNIRSTHDPDLYADPLSQAGAQDITCFFASLTEELKSVNGNVYQSPTFQAAVQRLTIANSPFTGNDVSFNNLSVEEKQRALKELVSVYYQAMAKNLKTQQHLLLNTLPTQMEFIAKALSEQLGIDKKYWPVLAKQRFYMQFQIDDDGSGGTSPTVSSLGAPGLFPVSGDTSHRLIRLSDQPFPEQSPVPAQSKTILEMLYDEKFRDKVAEKTSNSQYLTQELEKYLKIPNDNKQGISAAIEHTIFSRDYRKMPISFEIGPSNDELSVNLREPEKSYKSFLDQQITQRIKNYIALETERVILTSSNAAERLRDHAVSQPLDTLLTQQERQTIQAHSNHFKTDLNNVTNQDDYQDLSTSGQHVLNIARQVAGYLPVVGPFLSLALDAAAGDEEGAAFDAFLCLTMFIPQSGELSMLRKLIDVGVNGTMGFQAVKSALQARDSDALAAAFLNIGLSGHALYHSGVSLAHWDASEVPHQSMSTTEDKLTETLPPTPEETPQLPEERHPNTRPTYTLPLSDIEGLAMDAQNGTYHDPNGKQYIQMQGETAYVYEVDMVPHEPQLMQVVNPTTRNKLELIQRNKDGCWEKIGLKGGGGSEETSFLQDAELGSSRKRLRLSQIDFDKGLDLRQDLIGPRASIKINQVEHKYKFTVNEPGIHQKESIKDTPHIFLTREQLKALNIFSTRPFSAFNLKPTITVVEENGDEHTYTFPSTGQVNKEKSNALGTLPNGKKPRPSHIAVQWLIDEQAYQKSTSAWPAEETSQNAPEKVVKYVIDRMGTVATLAEHISPTTDDLYKKILYSSPKVNEVSHDQWGRMMAAQFQAMDPGQTHRFMLRTTNHVMACILKVENVNGQKRYIVKFYDPNQTSTHIQVEEADLKYIKQWTIKEFLTDNSQKNYYHLDPANKDRLTLFFSVPDTFFETKQRLEGPRHLRSYLSEDSTRSGARVYHHVAIGLLSAKTLIKWVKEGRSIDPLTARKRVFALLAAKNANDTPGLFAASRDGDIKSVKVYLDAIIMARYEILITKEYALELLVAKNANHTPGLFMALQNGHEAVVKAYVDALFKIYQVLPIPQGEAFELLQAKDKYGTSGFFMALQENKEAVVPVYADAVVQAFKNKAITLDQVFQLLQAKDKDGTPGLFIALQENKEAVVPVYADAVVQAFKNKAITLDQVFQLLQAKDKDGTPGLFMALQENKEAVVTAYVDAVVQTRKEKVITLDQVFQLLQAKDKDGTPGLFMALQENKEAVVTAYVDAVVQTRKDRVITQEEAFELLQAKDEDGTPGLFMAFKKGHTDVLNAYTKAIVEAARQGVITPKVVVQLLLAKTIKGTPLEFHLACQSGNKTFMKAYVGAVVEAFKKEAITQEQAFQLLQVKDENGTPRPFSAVKEAYAKAINKAGDQGVITQAQVLELLLEGEDDDSKRFGF